MKVGDRVESGTEQGTVVVVIKEEFRVEWDSAKYSHLNIYWHGPEKINAGAIVLLEPSAPSLPIPMVESLFPLEAINEYSDV